MQIQSNLTRNIIYDHAATKFFLQAKLFQLYSSSTILPTYLHIRIDDNILGQSPEIIWVILVTMS